MLQLLFIQPGEQISGSLDFRGSSVAADVAFRTNPNRSSSESLNEKNTDIVDNTTRAILEPHICLQYSVSLISVEQVADGCEPRENPDSIKSSLGSVDLPSPTSNMTSINNLTEQFNILARPPRSPTKQTPNHTLTEAEIVHSTSADVVVAADMVGFKLPCPEETAAPTFSTHIGIPI